MGVLKDPDSGKMDVQSSLPRNTCRRWMASSGRQKRRERETLDKALQLFFRRHRIDFQILKHPSDPKTKFDLFQRLDRGGAYANEQEVRTCSMVLADIEFTNALRKFVQREDFQKIFRISADQEANQQDLEYAVRLAVHTYEEFPRGRDVQEFLDQAILKVMSEHERDEVLGQVGWSVENYSRLFGDRALVPPKDRPAGIAPRFSLRALEGICVGVARHKRDTGDREPGMRLVRRRFRFWRQPEVAEMSSPGLRGGE